MKLYTAKEMCKILEIKLTTFYKLRFEKNIKPVKTVKNFNYFYKEQFEDDIPRYYPIKTHEVYYIYESKMNTNKQL
jgi:hypothetical protein